MGGFAITGLNAYGSVRVECVSASQALVELEKLRNGGKTINCVVEDDLGNPVREPDLERLAKTEEK